MSADTACVLCKSDLNDELQLGELFSDKGLVVHHYCLVNFTIFVFVNKNYLNSSF
jgi:hypothetical protein